MRRLLFAVALCSLPASVVGSATQSHEPFGQITQPATKRSALEFERQWKEVEFRWQGEQVILRECKNSAKLCSPAAELYISILEEVKLYTGLGRLQRIQQLLHGTTTFADDEVRWATPDRWSPSLETLAVGGGDCEDYAILAYNLLQDLGFSKNDLQVVIGKLMPRRPKLYKQMHAMLAVRYKGEWIILDNNKPTIWKDDLKQRYKPLYALTDTGVRQY